MFKIFAAIRALIARQGSSLGAIAVNAIREDFIPRLEKMLAEETNPGKKESIQDAMDVWEPYKRGTSSASSEWEDIASKAARDAASLVMLSPSMTEDIEQQIASYFYSKPTWEGVFDKFDPMGGPRTFMKWWRVLVYNAARRTAKLFKRKELEHHLGVRLQNVDEDTGEERLVAPRTHTELDEQVMQDDLDGLDKYVTTKLSREPAAALVYRMWMDLIERKEADEIVFSRDILPAALEELKSKGVDAKKSTIYASWKKMARTIIQYFEDELHKPVSKHMKKSLKLAERLAYSEYRRRLAAWVLGR